MDVWEIIVVVLAIPIGLASLGFAAGLPGTLVASVLLDPKASTRTTLLVVAGTGLVLFTILGLVLGLGIYALGLGALAGVAGAAYSYVTD